MKTIPEIKVVTAPATECRLYAVAGFDELERWMLLHSPIYRGAHDECQRLGIRGEDRLRVLLGVMARHAEMLKSEFADRVQQCFGPMSFEVLPPRADGGPVQPLELKGVQ